LSEESGLLEGVVGFVVGGGAADDEVVEEVDLEEGGRFGDAAGEVAVGTAGTRIAGGVVVDEKKAVGAVEDDGVEDVAGVGDGFVDGAVGDGEEAGGAEASVEKGDAEGFAGEVAHLGGEGVVGGDGGVEGGEAAVFSGHAGAEFEGGDELGGFGEAEAVLGGELGEVEVAEGGKTAVGLEEAAADLDGALALDADAEEDGEDLRIAEGGGTLAGHAFTGAEGVGKVVDADVHGGYSAHTFA